MSRASARNRYLAIWLLLAAITAVSWWAGARGIGAADGADAQVTLGVVLMACLKCRFVMREYMEVRIAPRWLRLSCDAWLIALLVTILSFYGGGR